MPSSTDTTPPVALSVAGSDSGGGAGIQADLKAMARAGVHGTTAITALTAQNSTGVRDIHPVPPDFVGQQIDAVTDDFDVRAAKTGMLHNRGVIDVVAQRASDELDPLVVDPVMVAESGDPLLESDAEEALVNQLIPRSALITPNLSEARRIGSRLGVKDAEDAPALARELADRLEGPAVLVTGGHHDEQTAVDSLSRPDGTLREYAAPRLETANTHGTGCVLSALITAFLARSRPLPEAVERAKTLLSEALEHGYAVGRGAGTLNLLDTEDG